MSGEMKQSVAHHQLLPEVTSLPDGFVESSAEPAFTSKNEEEEDDDNKTQPLDDTFTHASSSPEKPRSLSHKDDDESPRTTTLLPVSHHSDHLHDYTSTEERSRVDAANLLEKPTPEFTESSKTKKLDTPEVKRKNVKRSFKSEKEFLEFTLKHQQVIAERDSAVAVRVKLESLCRELQRQNKMLMDECKRVSTESQNMRIDLSTRFQDVIKDVSLKLEGQKDEYLTQLKENDMLRNKLKHLSDQYEVCEQQFTQKLKQKTLELQLSDLKIQQHENTLKQEQSQMKSYAEQVSQLLATEQTLRLQLAADGEKFQQFQDALIKSNEVFETFKQEIEKMSKSIKELKEENSFLKGKCERSDVTLIELVEEREQWKKQIEKLTKQKEKLESLCRSLQAERKQSSSTNCD